MYFSVFHSTRSNPPSNGTTGILLPLCPLCGEFKKASRRRLVTLPPPPSTPRFRTEFRFDSARGLDVRSTDDISCRSRLSRNFYWTSPSRREDGKIEEGRERNKNKKRGGREREGNTRCPLSREEASWHRFRISHRSFSLSLSLSLDKEASMNWSGVLDNLIKGRLPLRRPAPPIHSASLAPFCHP